MGYSWAGPNGGVDESGRPFRFKVPDRVCCGTKRFTDHRPECPLLNPEKDIGRC